jgi:hypothetical protein
VVRLQVAIRAHSVKLILLAKLSISLMIPTLVAAGLARVPWRRWFPVVFILELLWIGLLVQVGYHATGAITRFEHSLQTAGVIVLVLVIVCVVWYVRRVIRREEEQNTAPQPEKRFSPPPVVHPLPSQTVGARRKNGSEMPCTLETEPVRAIRDPKA